MGKNTINRLKKYLILGAVSAVVLFASVVFAAHVYTINGVNVSYTDYKSSPKECWVYANNFYRKIWGKNFTNQFSDPDNSLRELSDSELRLTAEHLEAYVSNAELGSILRICDKEYLHGTDGWGHSQLIVQKDENGFTVIEGGLSKYPYCKEAYYTWEQYANASWLGGRYDFIKYIKWPGATPYEEYQPPVCSGTFADVPDEAYYFDAVEWAAEKGITKGVDEKHFAPDETCTRAQIVTFIWRAFGSQEPETMDLPFDDVAEDAYYANAVRWAVENGITEGTSENTFSPNDPCTRAQIITFLWRMTGVQDAPETENPFTDVAEEDYFAEAVLWAVETGITQGTSADTFSPEDSCTRAQSVTFLYRLKSQVGEE